MRTGEARRALNPGGPPSNRRGLGMSKALRIVVGVVVATASLAPSTTAMAAIASTGGTVTKLVPPPASVTHPGSIDSNTNISAWDEQQGVTSGTGLKVDIVSPGTYTDLGQLCGRPSPRTR